MVFEIPQHFSGQKFSAPMIYDHGEVELIIVTGPDSADFLNRLSTLSLKNLSCKKQMEGSLHGAFLNGQAKLISLFTVWCREEKNYFFVEKEMFQKTKEYLEQMHFSENLKIETEKYFAIETRGENVDFPYEMKVEAYDWGLPGKYFFSREKLNIKNLEIQTLNQKEYDALRASFGYPKPLQDLTEEHILIEASLDTMVDRNKGCYPGQEVIEKIYTYGRVARKIKKLVFENANEEDIQSLQSALPLEIEVDGNKVGVLSSVYHRLDKDFGLATLKRLFYEKHQTIQIFHNGKILNARIE